MEKIKWKIFAIGFWGILVMFSVISCIRWADYYINDRVSNNEWVADGESKAETDYITNFWQKEQFVNLNGGMCRLLGQQEMNGIIKLNNGYLLLPMEYCSDETIAEMADSLAELNEYLKVRDIPMLYATTPYTSSKYDPQLPEGVEDYGNDNIDRLLEALARNGIETMDFRQLMYDEGIDQYDMMYRTDHHWTTEAGFWAYNKITSWLQEKLSCEIDPIIMEFDNYTVDTYSRWHLGSNGRRTGALYAGVDDFDLIIPKFETSIRRGETRATIQEWVYDMGPLQSRNYFAEDVYDTVLTDCFYTYTNEAAFNDKRVMVITDSQGKAVVPYIIMSFRETMIVRNVNTTLITKEMIEEFAPDVVLLLYYPKTSDDSNAFEYNFESLLEENSFGQYVSLLGNENYDAVIEIVNKDILRNAEFIQRLDVLGVDVDEVSEDTELIILKEGGNQSDVLNSMHESNVLVDTTLGAVGVFYGEDGTYGVYLNGEECMVIEPEENEGIDVRIRVFEEGTIDNTVDYIEFSISEEDDIVTDRVVRIVW